MADTEPTLQRLLEVTLTTYAQDIQPSVPEGKRYVAAMVANALQIARRRMKAEDPAAALLERLRDGSDIAFADLAQDIRTGRVSDSTHPGLAALLLEYVAAELTIANPRFLERRRRVA